MKQKVSITVNGVTHTQEVEPRLLLTHFLREELALTGTNVGCDTSHCGACTVLMDGDMISSCLTLAVMAVALTDMSTMPSTFCVMASSTLATSRSAFMSEM